MRKGIQGAFQAVTGLIQRTAESMRLYTALVPTFLQNLLWLIERTFIKLAEQGYGQNAVVYACLRLLSTSVAEPPLLAYTEDGEGNLAKLPRNHPLSALLRNPTPGLLTQYEFIELVTVYLGITGRFNALIERNNMGQPIGLWPLRPDRIGPIYSGLENPVNARVVKGWSYLIPGTTHYITIPREDVLTINLPDPAGESGGLVEGLGPLQVLASEVGADNEATKLVGALLANYATPSLIIKTKVPLADAEAAKRLKRRFMSQFGGARRGEPAVLDSDADVTPVSFNLNQLEFPDLRNIAEARIAAAYGTPAALVGLKTGIDRAADANLDGLRLYFAETTLADYWRRYGDAFSTQIAVNFGDDLVCAFDTRKVRALRHHTIQEADTIAEAFDRGVATVDEYRDKVLGLGPLPNGAGKVLYVPSTVQVVNETDPAAMADVNLDQAKNPPQPALPPGSSAGGKPALGRGNPQPKAKHLAVKMASGTAVLKFRPVADLLSPRDNTIEIDWHNTLSNAESSSDGDGIGELDEAFIERLAKLQDDYGTMLLFTCAGLTDNPEQGKRFLAALEKTGLNMDLVRLGDKAHVAASIDDRNVQYLGDVNATMDHAEQRVRAALGLDSAKKGVDGELEQTVRVISAALTSAARGR